MLISMHSAVTQIAIQAALKNPARRESLSRISSKYPRVKPACDDPGTPKKATRRTWKMGQIRKTASSAKTTGIRRNAFHDLAPMSAFCEITRGMSRRGRRARLRADLRGGRLDGDERATERVR